MRSSRRLVVGAGIAAALGLAPVASAEAAGPPTPSVSVQYEIVGGVCDVTITYTWSGIKGGHLTPTVGIVAAEDYGMWAERAPANGKSGTASATFAMEYTGVTAPAGYGFARLAKPNGTVLLDSLGWSDILTIPCRIPLP